MLEIEDYNDDGDPVRLDLEFMAINEDEKTKLRKEKMTHQDKKKEQEFLVNYVDHKDYQNANSSGKTKALVLHNMISLDFIRGVAKGLTCPICQEMVTNPVIYKNCLHRFCNNCIESYNRLGKKECPLCRKSIGNRR